MTTLASLFFSLAMLIRSAGGEAHQPAPDCLEARINATTITAVYYPNTHEDEVPTLDLISIDPVHGGLVAIYAGPNISC